MSNKLEVCPFCKNDNVEILGVKDENFRENKPCFAFCPDCGFESGIYANMKILLNHWNRRD